MIFLTSDEHFNHDNIRAYCQRPFPDTASMDEALIAAHNARVTSRDVVYHLGDFTLGGPKEAARYFARLNGHIHILPGSHDQRWFKDARCEYYSQSGYKVVREPPIVELSLPEHRVGSHALVVVLCHYPMARWNASHWCSLHAFGHCHNTFAGVGRSMDVGVDAAYQLYGQYRPMALDEFIDITSRKQGTNDAEERL